MVLRESRRAELAHRFIDYLLRPEVAAANLTCRAARRPARRVAGELRGNPVLYPPPEVLARGRVVADPAAARSSASATASGPRSSRREV